MRVHWGIWGIHPPTRKLKENVLFEKFSIIHREKYPIKCAQREISKPERSIQEYPHREKYPRTVFLN